MRYLSILLGLVLLLSLSAGAQSTTSNSGLLPASYFAVPATPDFAANAPTISLTPFSAAPANTPPGALAPSTPLSLSLIPPPEHERFQLQRGLLLEGLVRPGWRIRRDPRNSRQRQLLVPVRRRRSALPLVRAPRGRTLGACPGRLFALHAADARRQSARLRLRAGRWRGPALQTALGPAFRRGRHVHELLQRPPVQPHSPRGRGLPVLAPARQQCAAGHGL